MHLSINNACRAGAHIRLSQEAVRHANRHGDHVVYIVSMPYNCGETGEYAIQLWRNWGFPTLGYMPLGQSDHFGLYSVPLISVPLFVPNSPLDAMSQDMASPAVTLVDRLTSLSLGVDPASESLAA